MKTDYENGEKAQKKIDSEFGVVGVLVPSTDS